MIAGAILALGLLQSGESAQSASQVVSQMLARYNAAKSMTGTITLTQSVGPHSGKVVTELQFELPSKLFIRQTKSTGGLPAIVTSDGKLFSYPAPKLPGVDERTRLVEAVQPREGKTLTVRDIYAASVLSLYDRSTPLDIAIGRREDLDFLRNQWATLEYRGTTQDKGETLHVVVGKWREYGQAAITGDFRMKITADYELREFALSEGVSLGPQGVQQVLSVWAVDLKINGTPDPNLFKLVR